MPLMESFTMGYIQETWCDIFVKITKTGVPQLTFDPSNGTIGEILDVRGHHNEKERENKENKRTKRKKYERKREREKESFKRKKKQKQPLKV
jgi:hypothetical protein